MPTPATPAASIIWPHRNWGASIFGVSFDDTWEGLPALPEVKQQLHEWGVWDPGLGDMQCRERYVRFLGVTFGVAPRDTWPALRRDLLEFESRLACR